MGTPPFVYFLCRIFRGLFSLGSKPISAGNFIAGILRPFSQMPQLHLLYGCWLFYIIILLLLILSPFLPSFFFFCFLGPILWHIEVPRLGVESELQLPAYTTATTDPNHVCNPHHSSRQHQILNPLNKARDQTRIHVDASWTRFR